MVGEKTATPREYRARLSLWCGHLSEEAVFSKKISGRVLRNSLFDGLGPRDWLSRYWHPPVPVAVANTSANTRAEIDKGYLDKPYYIAPSGKTAAEAFAVIRDAMQDKERVALGRIVMAHREHIIALEPLGKGLLGTTLRYDYEVRDEKAYFKGIPSARIKKDMVQLAAHILESKAGHFDARKFKDQYENALKKLVRRKASGKKIDFAEPKEDKSNVINLMEALRNSVKGRKAKGGTKKRGGKKGTSRRSKAA